MMNCTKCGASFDETVTPANEAGMCAQCATAPVESAPVVEPVAPAEEPTSETPAV